MATATIVPNRNSGTLSRLLGRPIRCGFDADLATLFSGIDPLRTEVCVRIATTGHLLENGQAAPANPRAMVANVDSVEGARVIGWVVNTEDEQEAVDADILVDDRGAAGTVANQQHRGLLARFTTCDHGFKVVLTVRSGRVLRLRNRRSDAIVFFDEHYAETATHRQRLASVGRIAGQASSLFGRHARL